MEAGFSPKIFLVDDDLFSRAIHEQHFRNKGWGRYHSFGTMVECVSRFNEKPDVLIIDYRTQPVRGLKILSAIRKVLPHTYIVFIAGPSGIIECLLSLQEGAFAYIVKDGSYSKQLEAIFRQIELSEKILSRKP